MLTPALIPKANPCSFESKRACASSGCWLPRSLDSGACVSCRGPGRGVIPGLHTPTPTSTHCPQHRCTRTRTPCTCLYNTHVHTCREMGRHPIGLTPSAVGVEGGKWSQAGLAPGPITSLGRESRRRWPELSLQRPVEASGKGSAGDTLGCLLVGGHVPLVGVSRKVARSRVS